MVITSILMVCRGNICRSPMAQAYFAHQSNKINSNISITSAGISALEGYSADRNAIVVMKQNGIDIIDHRALQLTQYHIRNAKLILVMTTLQIAEIEQKYATAKGKLYLLGYWSKFEINDPYNQNLSAFERVYQQIELAWQDWKTRI